MSKPVDIADTLAGIALFAEIPRSELAEVARQSRVRRFRATQVIFTSGDPGDALLVVISGSIKLSVRSADGGELALTTVAGGGLIGELGVIDGGPRSADAEAAEAAEVLFIARDLVRGLLQRHPSVSAGLLESTAASLRRLTDTTADLVFLDLPRRVAKLLLDPPRDGQASNDLGLTQEEIAHRIGGTRQSVNAALRGFERRGWIELAYRRIIVRQPNDLARFAGEVTA